MVIINTKYGSFEGLTHKNLDLFLGIHAYPLLDIVVLNTLVHIYSYDTLVDATIQSNPPQPFNKLETFFSTTKQKFNLMKIAYI